MSDDQRGLYQKYNVTRKDGREISKGCFVMELKDHKARKAILTYAEEVEMTGKNLDLAYDLKSWVAQHEPVEEKEPKYKLFDMVVLIAPDKVLDDSSLYVVTANDVGEYITEADVALPAKLQVDMVTYNEKKKEMEEAKKKSASVGVDPLLQVVVNQIKSDFQESPYTDIQRYLDDKKDQHTKMLQDKYDVVVEKLSSDLEKETTSP